MDQLLQLKLPWSRLKGGTFINFYQETARKIPIYDKVDVIVVGGGPAGMIAAAAAKVAGADKVLLVERYGFLGGNLTAAGVLNIRVFNDHAGKLVVGGLPIKFIEKLKEYGGAVNEPAADSYVRHDPEITKYVADMFCKEHGVDMLFHTFVADVVKEAGNLQGIIIENKSGRSFIKSNVIIDATGDADLAVQAGVPYNKGDENGCLQPLSTTFVIGNVKPESWPNILPKDSKEIHNKLFDQGEYPVNHKSLGVFPSLQRQGEVYCNTSRVIADATNADELTNAELQGREQCHQVIAYLRKHIPGFEKCYLLRMAPQVGVRETRRIEGDYTLTREDVLQARDFADSIARGSYQIDIHHQNEKTTHIHLKPGTSYAIPYRSLLPKDVNGLLVAGRCISATSEAFASLRVMATGMAVGQAAGVAAGLAVIKSIAPRKLNVTDIQSLLDKVGGVY